MALYFILPRREIIKLEGHIYRRYGIKYGISVLDADLVGMVQAVVLAYMGIVKGKYRVIVRSFVGYNIIFTFTDDRLSLIHI